MRHVLNMGILLGITAVLVAGGCATTGSGLSDEDQIRALLGQWKEGILAKDADRIMATYSENFAHDGYDYQAEDKAGLREFIEGGIEQGSFDDVELDMEYMTIEIADGTATVYPIEYTIWEGTVTIELTLAKEEAGWLITDMAIEGM
jgi:hypothetical protein